MGTGESQLRWSKRSTEGGGGGGGGGAGKGTGGGC
jgi:hypothetical protein